MCIDQVHRLSPPIASARSSSNLPRRSMPSRCPRSSRPLGCGCRPRTIASWRPTTSWSLPPRRLKGPRMTARGRQRPMAMHWRKGRCLVGSIRLLLDMRAQRTALRCPHRLTSVHSSPQMHILHKRGSSCRARRAPASADGRGWIVNPCHSRVAACMQACQRQAEAVKSGGTGLPGKCQYIVRDSARHGGSGKERLCRWWWWGGIW